ncbi:MAG: DUF1993 domain-containing protein [Bauldia sp.]|jgi:hypothetical protein|nr:DUF1993 domain-containing protein [Bauldia sp.]
MPLTLSQLTLPTYRRILASLGEMLAKAEAHAAAHHYDPNVLLTERLFPDMWPFAKQVQQATALMVRGTCRLAGVAIPSFDDSRIGFDDLRSRIAETAAFLDGVDPAALDAGETREITFPAGGEQKTMSGLQYLQTFTLPNVWFHATTVYNILRHNGVPLKKSDFTGPI